MLLLSFFLPHVTTVGFPSGNGYARMQRYSPRAFKEMFCICHFPYQVLWAPVVRVRGIGGALTAIFLLRLAVLGLTGLLSSRDSPASVMTVCGLGKLSSFAALSSIHSRRYSLYFAVHARKSRALRSCLSPVSACSIRRRRRGRGSAQTLGIALRIRHWYVID